LEIQDFGMGIDPKDLPHIFERFYRADISRSKEKADGYGLGLSIAENIVKTNNGSISVKSTLKKGSKFSVFFPIKHV
jgi:signal transduction histidine kinase